MNGPSTQPGDLRVNRANLLRRIGRVCFESGGQPGLPAPARVYVSPTVELHFDTLAEVAEWVARYDLHPRRWTTDGHLFITATGLWEGVEIAVSSNQRQFAPADGGPDDVSNAVPVVHLLKPGSLGATCGSVIRYCDSVVNDPAGVTCTDCIPLVDNARREVEDGNGEPKPADVAGYGHERGTESFTEEPSLSRGYSATPKLDASDPEAYNTYAARLDTAVPGWWNDDVTAMAPELARLAELRRKVSGELDERIAANRQTAPIADHYDASAEHGEFTCACGDALRDLAELEWHIKQGGA